MSTTCWTSWSKWSPTDSANSRRTCCCVTPADVDEDIADVLDAMQAGDDEHMETWRVEARRQLAALPFRFPLTVTFQTRKPQA